MRTRWGLAATIVGLIGVVGCGGAPSGPPTPSGEASPASTSTVTAPGPAGAEVRGAWTVADENTPDGRMTRATVRTPEAELEVSSHEVWGRSVVVRFTGGGGYECSSVEPCTVAMRIDGREIPGIRGTRPQNPVPTLAFRDERAIWNAIRGGRTLVVTYPKTPSTPATLQFDVSGADQVQLPGF